MNPVLLFDCIGTLIDGYAMRLCYRRKLSQVMSARYSQSPDFWQEIDAQIVDDWANYHADLNFSGEDGIEDMHEGLFRVTRALFKIGSIPEPTKSEITALANDLISIPQDDTVLRDDAFTTVSQLSQNYRIGVFAHLLEAQLKAITASPPMIETHIGADTVNHYEHDKTYFMKVAIHLKTAPEQITVITKHRSTAECAIQAGFRVLVVQQSSASITHILKQL